MQNLVGQSLGRYRLTAQLGEGGMATVYRAFDASLERDVAIKVIRSDVPHDEMFLKRFMREARALAKLSHPNIVKVLDFGEYEGMPYLVMEYISGGVLKVGVPVPWNKAASLVAPVAMALHYAHDIGIIHRDIKPANILINELGMPMLSDFGIAKIVASQAKKEETLTGGGLGVGTPAYMAPEQGMGIPIDRRADIYSLGVVYYELVTGRVPFKADTPMATILKHINAPLPLPRTLIQGLPEPVERVICKAMAKRPDERYQTMAEFAAALDGLLRTGAVQPAPAPAVQPPRSSPNLPYAGQAAPGTPPQPAPGQPRPAGGTPLPQAPQRQQTPPPPPGPQKPVTPLPAAPVQPRPPTPIPPARPAASAEPLTRRVGSNPQIPAAPAQPPSQPSSAFSAPGVPLPPSGSSTGSQPGSRSFQQPGQPGATAVYPQNVAQPPARTVAQAFSSAAAPAPAARPKRTGLFLGLGAAGIVGLIVVVIIVVVVLSRALSPGNNTAPTQAAVTSAPGTIPMLSGLPVLRVGLFDQPEVLDPQKASYMTDISHLKLIYEGLTRLDRNLNTTPAAAEKWEYNANATEITFTLRKGLKYSDGTLLNAKRFEYSILRNIDPQTGGEYAGITDDILGAQEWRTADLKKTGADEMARLKTGVKVKALDSKGSACTDYNQADCLILKIGLRQPTPHFHTIMSLWVAYPAKEENIYQGGQDWSILPQYQVGNGPFVLKSYKGAQSSAFTPNLNYWRGQGTYDIELRYDYDASTVLDAYKKDDVDIIPLEAVDLQSVESDATLNSQKWVYPGSCTSAIMFNQQKEPFNDQNVRAAFSYAIDRDAWVRDMLQGLGSPTLTWIPKGFPGYDAAENRWGYNPDKAKAALKASGYGSAAALPVITATFTDSTASRTRWEWLAARWKEVLGVTVKLNGVDSAAFDTMLRNQEPQVTILGWCADYPDPQNWLSVYWKSGSSFANRIGYSNPALDQLLTQADTTTDAAKRLDLYARAQKLLTDGVPAVFLWNDVEAYLVKPWVKGYVQTPMDGRFPGDTDPLTITLSKK